MNISLLTPDPLKLPQSMEQKNAAGGEELSFGDMLKEQINEVNDLKQQANALTEKFLAGEEVDLHQVMVAVEKAGLATQLTLEVRNKLVDAYNRMSRMQI